jgi:hypothetical protein
LKDGVLDVTRLNIAKPGELYKVRIFSELFDFTPTFFTMEKRFAAMETLHLRDEIWHQCYTTQIGCTSLVSKDKIIPTSMFKPTFSSVEQEDWAGLGLVRPGIMILILLSRGGFANSLTSFLLTRGSTIPITPKSSTPLSMNPTVALFHMHEAPFKKRPIRYHDNSYLSPPPPSPVFWRTVDQPFPRTIFWFISNSDCCGQAIGNSEGYAG